MLLKLKFHARKYRMRHVAFIVGRGNLGCVIRTRDRQTTIPWEGNRDLLAGHARQRRKTEGKHAAGTRG